MIITPTFGSVADWVDTLLTTMEASASLHLDRFAGFQQSHAPSSNKSGARVNYLDFCQDILRQFFDPDLRMPEQFKYRLACINIGESDDISIWKPVFYNTFPSCLEPPELILTTSPYFFRLTDEEYRTPVKLTQLTEQPAIYRCFRSEKERDLNLEFTKMLFVSPDFV